MIKVDLSKGDTILTGKYRNKKETVKTFGFDEHGQPTVNGRKMLSFRIEKLMKKDKENQTEVKGETGKRILELVNILKREV